MDKIKEAARILNEGGIVIFPTDTAFGIGCRIDRPDAIKKLYAIRKRPISQPMPVLIDSISIAEDYFLSPISNVVRHFMQKYWPGALTIIYPCQKRKVNPLIRGSKDNIGLRMPNHPVALQLIRETKVPILGPSANFHGLPTPYKFENLDKDLLKLADDCLYGSCQVGLSSTIVDCSVSPYKILRQGKIIPSI